MSAEGATTKDLFGDSSSSSEEEKEEAKPSEETPTAAKPKPSIHDDDESSDDDNEFDDKGAVVGLPSTSMAGTKLNPSKTTAEEEKEDPLSDDSDIEMEDVQSKGPQILKSKLIALEKQNVPKGVHLYMTKLPNLVGIQTQAFETKTYAPAIEEEEFGQSVYNLIRWRYQKDASGNLIRGNNSNGDGDDDKLQRESNTRLVEWEDGSFSLHIGNEAFEVDTLNAAKEGFAGLNGYVYQSQKATIITENNSSTTDNPEKQPAGTILECTAPVHARLTVRPSSLQSDAHKSLTVGIRQKTIKTAKIAEYVTQEDPEMAKQARIRVKEDLEKSSARKRAYPGGGGGGGYRRQQPRMSRDYLEEEDDGNYDTFNVKDAKKRAKEGAFDDDDDDEDMGDFGDDSSSEDEYDQTFKQAAAKKKEGDKNAQEMEEEEDDDDEEEDVQVSTAAKAKKPAKAVFEDSDDSD